MSEFTKKISGVINSRNASQEIRNSLLRESEEACVAGNFMLEHRLKTCSECPMLKEEFKLFKITIMDKTPTCGECGCNLNLKTKLEMFSCPLNNW